MSELQVTLPLSFLITVKDMMDEQRRFFELSKAAKARRTPEIWKQRKQALDNSRQLESLVYARLEAELDKFNQTPIRK